MSRSKGAGRGGRRPAAGGASAADEQQVSDVRATERRLFEAHLAHFPVAAPALIPAPAAIDEEQVRRQQSERLLSGISRFNRARRAATHEEAVRNADAQSARLRIARLDSLARAQAYADRSWDLLAGHDDDAVRAALADAYESNAFPTRVLEVWTEGPVHGVTVVVFFDAFDAVPRLAVVEDSDGSVWLRERGQRARHGCYLTAMGSTVLATVRQTLAACASVGTVSVLVVRDDGGETAALFVGQFDRAAATSPCRWDADPARALLDSTDGLFRLTGPDHEVTPLDAGQLPGLQDLLATLPATR